MLRKAEYKVTCKPWINYILKYRKYKNVLNEHVPYLTENIVKVSLDLFLICNFDVYLNGSATGNCSWTISKSNWPFQSPQKCLLKLEKPVFLH